MEDGAEIVRFQNVGMRYGLGSEVLHDISFRLNAGSFHFLTGASGAGKSSLLRLMYLAHRPSRGLITLFGNDTSIVPRAALPPMRRRIGVVFQEFRLLGHLTALENVALPLRIAGAKEEEIRDHVKELLKWVELEDQIDARPPTLSGGQKQRVALARALIKKPAILILDDAFSSLDVETEIIILKNIREVIKGMTTLCVTHMFSMALAMD